MLVWSVPGCFKSTRFHIYRHQSSRNRITSRTPFPSRTISRCITIEHPFQINPFLHVSKCNSLLALDQVSLEEKKKEREKKKNEKKEARDYFPSAFLSPSHTSLLVLSLVLWGKKKNFLKDHSSYYTRWFHAYQTCSRSPVRMCMRVQFQTNRECPIVLFYLSDPATAVLIKLSYAPKILSIHL